MARRGQGLTHRQQTALEAEDATLTYAAAASEPSSDSRARFAALPVLRRLNTQSLLPAPRLHQSNPAQLTTKMASTTETTHAAAVTTTADAGSAAEMHELQQQLKKRVRHRSIADGKSMYFGKYVSQEGSEKLLTYQYHGSDNSLIYKHVLTPMNDFLVEFLPLWLAPNLVRPCAASVSDMSSVRWSQASCITHTLALAPLAAHASSRSR